jgi:maltose O-acetyltransferase
MANIKKVMSRVLYESFARNLPEHIFPGGHAFARLRTFLARGFVKHVGKDVMIDRNVHLGADISIGNGTGIGPNCRIAGGTAIGKGCCLAWDVVVLTYNHFFEPNKIAYGKVKARVVIGDYVWIGARAIILPGVTIGDNVVVGAGSVVTKDVKPNMVIAGNPARKIKDVGAGLRVDWDAEILDAGPSGVPT